MRVYDGCFILKMVIKDYRGNSSKGGAISRRSSTANPHDIGGLYIDGVAGESR